MAPRFASRRRSSPRRTTSTSRCSSWQRCCRGCAPRDCTDRYADTHWAVLLTQAAGAPELITPELPLTDDLPLRLALAVESLTGLRTYFNGALGRGSRMWLLLEGAQLELPAPDMITTAGVITRGLITTAVTDHRRAVRSYAGHRAIPLADDQVMTLTLPEGVVTIEFEHDRISGVHATNQPAS